MFLPLLRIRYSARRTCSPSAEPDEPTEHDLPNRSIMPQHTRHACSQSIEPGIGEMRTARGTTEQAGTKILVKIGDPGQAEDLSRDSHRLPIHPLPSYPRQVSIHGLTRGITCR